MYMFYADVFGYIPMGNDGMIKVPAAVARSNRKLGQLARTFKAGRRGRIYLMASWTQQMSELGPRAFCDYIARYGVKMDI